MESTDKEGYFKGKLKIIVTIYRAEAWRPHNVELVLEIVATVMMSSRSVQDIPGRLWQTTKIRHERLQFDVNFQLSRTTLEV